jgi:hypothetical protein
MAALGKGGNQRDGLHRENRRLIDGSRPDSAGCAGPARDFTIAQPSREIVAQRWTFRQTQSMSPQIHGARVDVNPSLGVRKVRGARHS